MNYKRIEIYLGWTCNQKCTYCMEYENMEKYWNKKINKYNILKKLIKYKKLGYNHVTFLGGEPFIQKIFLDALKIGKKLKYTILVSTNCTTLHLKKHAEKFLPYIDELFLSFEALNKEHQQKISRTKNYVKWEKVFLNIKKYWSGNLLKVNIVLTKDNLDLIYMIIKYLIKKDIKNISITYPDISFNYYGKKHILLYVAPKYTECINKLEDSIELCYKKSIKLKLPDFPFCIFPKENLQRYIKLTDDYDYATRIKIDYNKNLNRRNLMEEDDIPRERFWGKKCIDCIYKGKCWGYSIYYNKLYGLNEINAIKH